MSTQIEIVEPKVAQVERLPVGATIVTPMMMLDRAVSNGAPIETIERLAALAERMEAQRAEKAFAKAFAAAKANIPPIIKNRDGHNGKYADFHAVASVVDPILSANGLFYKHRTVQQPDGTVLMVCQLWHEEGHREENSLAAKPDAGGNKNSIQAVGSTQTYLMRYTLLASLGIAPSNDDDGRSSGDRPAETITPEEVEAIDAMIDAVKADRPAFLRFLKVERLEDLPSKQYDAAVSALRRKVQANG